ncbi:MAG: Wzz/FepE/Etk N-terminal domain-containing protein [Candidatus Krumholzibacteriia bacterium]
MDPFLDEERPKGTGFDPLAIVRMFWRRKWLFFVPFVICLAMAFVAVRTMTPIYESNGQIRVVQETSNSRLIESDAGRRVQRARDVDRETIANIWTIVTAPKFLETVVRETQLYTGRARMPESGDVLPDVLTPEEMDAVKRAARELGQQIRVREDGFHIFVLGVRDVDPRQAFILARVVLDRFLEEERASRVGTRSTTRDFLTRQRETYARDLASSEDSLAAYQRGILNESLIGNPIDASNLAQVETNLLRLRDQHYNADVNEMSRLEDQARAVVRNLPDVQVIMRDPDIAQVASDLYDLELNRTLDTGDASLGASLGRARVRLNTLVEQRVERDYADLGIMDRNRLTQYVFFMIYRTAKQRVVDEVSDHIRAYREFTTRQPKQSARLQELQDEVANRRDMLESIEREITQQTINLEASMSEIGYRIEVRRDPVQTRFPVEPDKLKLYFMGVVLSTALGFGLVILSVMLDRTFTSVDEIERTLGLKVIGTLPVIQDEHFKRKRRLRLLRWIVLVVAVLGVAAVFLLYIYPRFT